MDGCTGQYKPQKAGHNAERRSALVRHAIARVNRGLGDRSDDLAAGARRRLLIDCGLVLACALAIAAVMPRLARVATGKTDSTLAEHPIVTGPALVRTGSGPLSTRRRERGDRGALRRDTACRGRLTRATDVVPRSRAREGHRSKK